MAKMGSKHARLRFRKWIDSYEAVAAWLEKHGDLEQLLLANGGIVKIDNFLPTFVAQGILEMLQSIRDETWNLTAAGDDYEHNNIRHEFLSVKHGPPGLQDVFRVLTLLLPDKLFTFSAAKYCKSGHIVAHDDRAYTQVRMEDGSLQLCSRHIACIYYLTKDWTAADGGQLIDLEAAGEPQQYVPAFNSVIAFHIPRWHEVKPVLSDRPRYSFFGWFLEPGKLYGLDTGEAAPPSAQQQQQQQQQEEDHQAVQQQQQQQPQTQPQVKAKKKKKNKKRHLLEKDHQAVQQQQQQQHGCSNACRPEQAHTQTLEVQPAPLKEQNVKRLKLQQQQQRRRQRMRLPGPEEQQQQQQQQQPIAAAAPAAEPLAGQQQQQPRKKSKRQKVLEAEVPPMLVLHMQQQQQQRRRKEKLKSGNSSRLLG